MDGSENSPSVQRLKRALVALEKMQSRISELETAAAEPIAVIGMGARMPGGVDSPAAFWELLKEGVDATSDVPPDRWDLNVYYDPDPNAPGKMYTRRGAFVPHLREFDAHFFRISPREALTLDPQQRLVLEVSWEALEDAAIAPDSLTGSLTGVFLGIASTEYFQHLEKNHHDENDIYVGTGNTHSAAAGRLSFILGVQGPSVAVDTACSSSLVGVHLACQSLRNRECHLALAGGVNRIVVPQVSVHFSKVHALSRDGRSKTFDASADGYGRGEGCGFVVLKRLSDAVSHGDNIRAVILGSSVNHDGVSSGLTVPNGQAQQAVLRQALGAARVRPGQVGYVEAHGTGTPLGDPIEVRALQAVFGTGRPVESPLVIGSVKTNIGHLEPAAGIAGLIKTVLALQHGEIPPHLHVKEPNPHVAWNDYPLLIPQRRMAWPSANGERIAGVSAFGFSGTNAHVVLRSYPTPPAKPASQSADRSCHILALSAKTENALNDLITRYRTHLETASDQSFADICFTANTGRSHFDHRAAVVAAFTPVALSQLHDGNFARGHNAAPPRIAFLFTGQGSQYLGMGRELYETQSTFRSVCEQCDAAVQKTSRRSLISLLYGPEKDERALQQTANTQLVLFMLEYALASVWRSWGIEPVALMGHSIGEFAAACLADVFTLEDALKLVAARARLMGSLPSGGGMVAVLADEAQVSSALRHYSGDVSIAAVNGPANTVIAGRNEILDHAVSSLKSRGLTTRRLNVSHAFHSSLMDPILSEFRSVAGEIKYSTPQVSVVSNLFGRIVSDEMATAEYWVRQLREPVRFAEGVETLVRQDIDIFLEVGPGATLLGMSRQCLPHKQMEFLATLAPGKSDWQTVLTSLAPLYSRGSAVEWKAFDKDYRRQPVVLPTYPFQRQLFWVESGSTAKQPSGRNSIAVPATKNLHPLLGRRVHLPPPNQGILFENYLSVDSPAFLNDHRILGSAIAPGAGFVEIASAAAAQLARGAAWQLENVSFEKALPLTAEETAIQISLVGAGEGNFAFEILSCRDESVPEPVWIRHAAGLATKPSALPDWTNISLNSLRAQCQDELSPEVFYTKCRERGIDYGPAFRGLVGAWSLGDGVAGHIQLPASLAPQTNSYRFHPALLDACLQPLGIFLQASAGTEPWVPLGFERFVILQEPGTEVWSYVRRRPQSNGSTSPELHVDALIFAPDGRLLAVIENLRAGKAQAALGQPKQNSFEDWFYNVEWRPQSIEHQVEPIPVPVGAAHFKADILAELPEMVRSRPILENYLPGFDALEKTNFLFVLDAFHELGATLEPGERFTAAGLASRLGIIQRHQRLFSHLLEFLASRNLLSREGDHWTVTGRLTPGNGLVALRETVRRYPAIEAEATLLSLCAPQLAGVLTGRLDPLQLLFPGGDLTAATRLYRDSPGAELMNSLVSKAVVKFLESVGEHRMLRVLEIGGGTGATTSCLLPHLPPHRTEYLFSDVSPLFVARFKKQFGGLPHVTTCVFDVEKDPVSQGLAPHGFDIVIAAQVLHATEDLTRTLSHVRSLLAPDGLLVLLEPTTDTLTAELASGLLPGWWRFTDFHLRPSSPLLTAAQWQSLLYETGFEQVETICPTEAGQVSVDATVILAQLEPAPSKPAKPWIVFADSGDIGSRLASKLDTCVLVRQGDRYRKLDDNHYEITGRSRDEFSRLFQEVMPSDGIQPGVVYLWGLDVSPGDIPAAARDVSLTALNLIQSLVTSRRDASPKLWLATRNSIPLDVEIGSGALIASALWGVCKVAALEHPDLACVLIDIPQESDSAVQSLWNEVRSASSNEQVAIRNGQRFVARLSRSTPPQPQFSNGAYSLGISSRGTPENLRYDSLAPRPPGPREVQVNVKATGLNFADVMDALGLLPFERASFGVEFAGVITQTGSNVDYQVGDRVFGAAPGSFDSHVTASASRIRKIPQALSFADAATITVAFATAYYSLHQIAGMKPGDRVLIHAAAGGVGLAAVQLAQAVGAEIFATAHPDKWQRLREWGVEHIMNSRTTDFADEVLAFTKGEGVDIVLNSLTGDAIPKSLAILRPGGGFIEIGKRDIWSTARVAEAKPGIQYHVVDLLSMLSGENQSLDPVLDPLVKLFEDGLLRPLPLTAFPLEEVVPAFRYMQQAKHFGKVVLVHPEGAEAPSSDTRFPNDASYLIAGGMGGLGLVAAEWLVTRGARNIVLMGRREPTPEIIQAVKRLEGIGANIAIFRGDVSQDEDVARALRHIKTALPPLRGIIHSAAVLDDATIMNQSKVTFHRVFAPKVDGAWSLHSQTSGLDLDFFILFSAGASLLGNPGQANYVAANAFLDSLAHFRRQQGLPAMSINWGPWAGVGVAAARGLDERVKMLGVDSIQPWQGPEILDRLYRWNPVQAGVLPIHWAEVAQHFVEWPFVSEFRKETRMPTGVESEFLKKLEGLPLDEKRSLIAGHVRSQMAAVLGLKDTDEIGLNQGFFDLGMDSLTVVELRNKLQATLGCTLSPTLAFDYPTVGGLIDFVSRQVLSASEPVAETPGEEHLDAGVSAVLAQVEQLSDTDALASLKRKRATT